jgi:hypothetical protein
MVPGRDHPESLSVDAEGKWETPSPCCNNCNVAFMFSKVSTGK